MFNLQAYGQTSRELISQDVLKQIKDKVDNFLNDNRFNYVITVENFKEAKKETTKLSKLKNSFFEFRKKIYENEAKDIEAFKKAFMGFEKEIEAKRKERLAEIEKFEDEIREKAKRLLNKYAEELIKEKGLRPAFSYIETNDLIKLSNLTSAGNLTSAVKKEIENRVKEALAEQTKYDARAELFKAKCIQAGIEPVNPENYKHLLFCDDETFNQEVDKVIQREINRQKAIEERLKKQVEAEAKMRAETDANAKKAEEQKQVELKILTDTKSDFSFYKATIEFEFKTKTKKSIEELEKSLKDKLEKVGILNSRVKIIKG